MGLSRLEGIKDCLDRFDSKITVEADEFISLLTKIPEEQLLFKIYWRQQQGERADGIIQDLDLNGDVANCLRVVGKLTMPTQSHPEIAKELEIKLDKVTEISNLLLTLNE